MNTPIRRERVYEQITDVLRREIASQAAPGARLPSVRQLAKRFAVSVPTVSQALVILAKEGLVDRRHGSGTFVTASEVPAVAPAGIGLVTDLDVLHPTTSRFFPYVLSELRRRLNAAGYPTRLYLGKKLAWEGEDAVTREMYREVLADASRGNLRAVVALHALADPEDWVRRLTALQIPVVGDGPVFPYAVLHPAQQWVPAAVRHLVAQGRRRLAMLCWGTGGLADAFREELERHGLDYRSEWVCGDIHPTKPGAGWAEWREVWTMRREKPDGLVIADDQLAVDACHAISRLGIRVPEELMVVTHANKGCSMDLALPVTRLEYDPVAHAEAIIEMVLKLLRGERVDQPHIRLETRVAAVLDQTVAARTPRGSSSAT